MINPIQAIKAFFMIRSTTTEAIKEASTMDGVKPGWKTTEFWVKIVTIDLPMIWAVIHSFIPPSLAVEVELGATAIYTIGRVVVKAVNDIKAARLSGAPAATIATASVSTAS